MSVGRGRGRGFAEARETVLRRPGQSLTSKFTSLIELIDGLTLSSVSSNVNQIAQAIIDATKSNTLKEVFEDLHSAALEDGEFGTKLTTACTDAKVYSINDCNLRLIMLQTLQKDFEEREENKKKGKQYFRNTVTLLGNVYERYVAPNGANLDILAGPLLQYLEMLLDSSEEEDIGLLSSLVIANMQKLSKCCPSEFEDLLFRARETLIHRNLSARSRRSLLYIADTTSSYLPKEKLNNFYKDQFLDGTADTQFNKLENSHVQSGTDNNVGNNIKSPKQGKGPGFGAHEKSPSNAGNERPSVPRAIRGAGAVDNAKDKTTKKSPRGKKDKLTDEQIWSSKQNTSSKVWGHDDRFEKDY